ncbi:hypothetical protein D1B33_07450 [Lysinibacillus yapensis]|uniref:Uncharacterized protein n=1 Tax=Ureibacillus yapensis TaxID=2304605 RepID=A0A396SCF2_9BACL|nr:hypothetical protein [Lysinibacillus yapensis]RHW38700.1 hypothetical protein D1B33_07450 [Lysinibacillus yapensis]
MKIQKLTLKELETVEVDGEFEARYVNAKAYPIFLTNSAVQKGYQLGYLTSSLISDLVKMLPYIQSGNEMEMIGQIDETKMIRTIYLAFSGANKKEDLSFEEFIELYHLDFTETVTLFANIIADTVSNNNNFAKGLQQSTKNEKKNSNLPS